MAPRLAVSQGAAREGRLQFGDRGPGRPPQRSEDPRELRVRNPALGSSAKGTEFFLRHMLGTGNEVNAEELEEGNRPASGQLARLTPLLGLMWVADFRNTSTTP